MSQLNRQLAEGKKKEYFHPQQGFLTLCEILMLSPAGY